MTAFPSPSAGIIGCAWFAALELCIRLHNVWVWRGFFGKIVKQRQTFQRTKALSSNKARGCTNIPVLDGWTSGRESASCPGQQLRQRQTEDPFPCAATKTHPYLPRAMSGAMKRKLDSSDSKAGSQCVGNPSVWGSAGYVSWGGR